MIPPYAKTTEGNISQFHSLSTSPGGASLRSPEGRLVTSPKGGLRALGVALLLPLALSLMPGTSQASNDNFRLSNMVQPDWEVYSDVQQAYLMETFSKELGSILSYKYTFSGDTTGFYGFDIGFEAHNAYVDTDRECPPDQPLCVQGTNHAKWDPWRVFDSDHRLTTGKLLMVPGLRIRKGLPLSLEVGSAFYFLPFSSQAAIQGFGRWAFHEGFDSGAYRAIPDMAVTLAYTQLLGNPELDMGILDWGFTFGYSVPAGGVTRSKVGEFSFFGGFGRSLITAVPDEQLPEELLCLQGYTGRQSKVESFADEATQSRCGPERVVYNGDFAPFKGSFGVRVHSERYELTVSTEFAGLGVPSVSVRTGLMF